MKQALIDTDTLSFFFRNNANVVRLLDKYLQEFGYINVSVITYYEVLNGLYFKDAKKQLTVFERFIQLNKVLPLTDSIAKKSAEIYADLRSKGQVIGHNDTLIAGTAIISDMKLITNNIDHFSRIDELDTENWITQ
ncbi:MAG: type II toxin-antitoxin system VapC family toxin [Bacteroidetes bacterium]|nr:type II toxin-antitoxin system VapC family toxin [Bacteroidota bacterium]NCQ11336.1 type II toxin-antitoxin system VapC family toxin [Bacteroidota bacterium]